MVNREFKALRLIPGKSTMPRPKGEGHPQDLVSSADDESFFELCNSIDWEALRPFGWGQVGEK